MRENARIKAARRLRKSLTPPEVWLWVKLRQVDANGVIFRRQHAVGPFILDFYCVKARLAIEVDGEIHERGDNPQRDARRDDWLRAQGIEVFRINAKDVYADSDEVAFGVRALAAERLAKALL